MNHRQVRLKQPLVVYKKVNSVSTKTRNEKNAVIEMVIPSGVYVNVPALFDQFTGRPLSVESQEYLDIYKTLSLNSAKCRAERARVNHLMADLPKTRKLLSSWNSNPRLEYVPGKLAKPNGYAKTTVVCAPGIHFFLTRSQANRWSL